MGTKINCIHFNRDCCCKEPANKKWYGLPVCKLFVHLRGECNLQVKLPRPKKPNTLKPDTEVIKAIENIKTTFHVERRNGNLNAEFLLRRL